MDTTGVELDTLLDGSLLALEAEISAVRTDLRSRGLDAPIEAGEGVRVGGPGPATRYEWILPPGTYLVRVEDAVHVDAERGSGLGFVTGFDAARRAVRISLGDRLGPHPGPAVLTFDPTWLLASLATRLREIGDDPERFHPSTALRLFGRQYPEPGRAEPRGREIEHLNGSQREALARVLGSRSQLVWGPPGTGKTRLLGSVVAELAESGRVLVVATTNVAVDEAAARVAARIGDSGIERNRLIRVGAEFSITGDPRLTVQAAVERAELQRPGRLTRALLELEGAWLDGRGRSKTVQMSLAERQARLHARARAEQDESLIARVARLGSDAARASRAALDEADILVTTFARLAVRDELAAQRFSHVVIDEASAAPLPHVLHAACLASERAAAFGDFQQLPPVVISREPSARRWLSRDLFRETGVIAAKSGEPTGAAPDAAPRGSESGVDGLSLPSPGDRLCVMLDEQYRMRPAIRAVVSDLFYGGRLRDAEPVCASDDGSPALLLLDTHGLEPTVTRVEGSRENPAHVEVVTQLLELFGREGVRDVGVVTPYRAQTRLLRRTVRGRLGRTAPADLDISTIHRFQGREKQVVVLDSVDAPPGKSWFLDERRNPDFARLLNVALSRSRRLLVLVATRPGLERTLPAEALLNRVTRRIARDGETIDGRRVLDAAPVIRAAALGNGPDSGWNPPASQG